MPIGRTTVNSYARSVEDIAVHTGAVAATSPQQLNGRQHIAQGHDGHRKQVCTSQSKHTIAAFLCAALWVKLARYLQTDIQHAHKSCCALIGSQFACKHMYKNFSSGVRHNVHINNTLVCHCASRQAWLTTNTGYKYTHAAGWHTWQRPWQ